ncbi:L-alanine-DL-glutamate epimerase-like enolase superfamily enzyme [Rhodoligotrophos appendicifer]|uniref:N-acetyl-D-Glu racemase DgcA n=1 Tax=Rhodoligotrophos appendicifer TaxID=987056 RepID=UPI0011849B5E|nr:N-acetyl-D-Glu racemase DgcA [Rhodoligotrophos appendicifer]
MRSLAVAHESWPIAGTFTISRGSKTSAEVVVATLTEDGVTGRGECVPYPRYGETVAAVMTQIEAMAGEIGAGLDRDRLRSRMPAGAARNALDCALWDLEAKQAGRRAWSLAGLAEMKPLVTAFTLSLDEPAAMAAQAARSADRPLLKLKLGTADGDIARLEAVRRAAPKTRLVVDANEGWRPEQLPDLFRACADLGVELIEQPLPASDDDALAGLDRPIAICADEAAHGLDTLPRLIGKYDAINIKLDKTGGLTEALMLAEAAAAQGMQIMVGCMLSTSLAMAPAMIAAQTASVVDLDGPLLLARDRDPGITFDGSIMQPPPPALWG